jgi:hypothetical protein
MGVIDENALGGAREEWEKNYAEKIASYIEYPRGHSSITCMPPILWVYSPRMN